MAEQAKGRRTDLNMPQAKVKRMAAQNQTYGAATQQLESQRAVPMGAGPTQVQARPRPKPGGSDFLRRSERPDEPITSGAPFGAGMGPAAAGVPVYDIRRNALDEIRFIAEVDRNEDLMDLLSRWMA